MQLTCSLLRYRQMLLCTYSGKSQLPPRSPRPLWAKPILAAPCLWEGRFPAAIPWALGGRCLACSSCSCSLPVTSLPLPGGSLGPARGCGPALRGGAGQPPGPGPGRRREVSPGRPVGPAPFSSLPARAGPSGKLGFGSSLPESAVPPVRFAGAEPQRGAGPVPPTAPSADGEGGGAPRRPPRRG